MRRRLIVTAAFLAALNVAALSAHAAELAGPQRNFKVAQAPAENSEGAEDKDKRGDRGKRRGDRGEGAAPPPQSQQAPAAPSPGERRGQGDRGPPKAEKRQAQPSPPPAGEQQNKDRDRRGGRERGERAQPSAPPPAPQAQPAPPPAAPTVQKQDKEKDRREGRRERERTPAAAPPPPPQAQPATPAPPAAQQQSQDKDRGKDRKDGRRERGERAPPPAPQAQPAPAPAATPAPASIDEVKRRRRQRVEDGGRRTIIEEPGNRTIVQEKGAPAMIRHDESERMRRTSRDVRREQRPDGGNLTIAIRPGGIEVFSEFDSSGRLTRRYRRDRNGREVNLIDNRRFRRDAPVILKLAPPVLRIPRDRYILDYERASDDDLFEALMDDPVERLERGYSLDEVRYNGYLRDRMRRIDLDTVNFDFGAWQVHPDQYRRLERIARIINRILDRHPDEVFLIEGHTDAVGSDLDNLTLSDRRAEEVAIILTETFDVPPENLITQGYGEEFLKVPTLQAERANRRVAVRRITPLLARN